jgi:hypothetical protein
MRRLTLTLLCCAAFAASAPVAPAQERPKGYYAALPATQIAPEDSPAAQFAAITSPTPLPTFTYTLTASAALGGGVFSGSIVGRSPLNRGKTTTTIPTQIVPLIITITDTTKTPPTTVTYDPTLPDSCAPGVVKPTDVSIITGSPIFTNTTTWTMNGVNVGTTQYIDAFQRAQFWGQVQGTPYHLTLQQSMVAPQALTFSGSGVSGSSGPGTNNPTNQFVGGCATGSIGVVNFHDLDNAVQALIKGPLAGTVNVGTFPIFLTKAVVMADPGESLFANCCILGFHSGLFVGGNLQIYSPFALDMTGIFDDDVSTLAHEMGEAINDPTVGNGTPIWGNIGQVVGACQNNLEVGDPLSPGFGTPTNEFTVSAAGQPIPTYHLQELAFYSWFFGSTALGAGTGGLFSDNGTFKGDAIICPPGGTN